MEVLFSKMVPWYMYFNFLWKKIAKVGKVKLKQYPFCVMGTTNVAFCKMWTFWKKSKFWHEFKNNLTVYWLQIHPQKWCIESSQWFRGEKSLHKLFTAKSSLVSVGISNSLRFSLIVTWTLERMCTQNIGMSTKRARVSRTMHDTANSPTTMGVANCCLKYLPQKFQGFATWLLLRLWSGHANIDRWRKLLPVTGSGEKYRLPDLGLLLNTWRCDNDRCRKNGGSRGWAGAFFAIQDVSVMRDYLTPVLLFLEPMLFAGINLKILAPEPVTAN